MDIFSVISLLGGLAFFLYGMHILSTGLEKMVGGKLEKVLNSLTANKFKALAVGTVVTMAVQSSSAVTVMLVGLVNSGIMKFSQSIGVIMGTNIGTTFTAWILSATGIESDNLIINFLKPDAFSLVVAFVGIFFIVVSKSSRKKDIGTVMLGFAILIMGMTVMGDAVKPLADEPIFQNAFAMFSNPFLGILLGAGVTAVIQSSSASLGILQSLSLTGAITFGSAIPIIMGQNIGTCITAVLSSIGANKNAKRVTAVHVYFNLIGTAVGLSLFYLFDFIFKFTFTNDLVNHFYIAIIHTSFNIFTTLLLFPFIKQLEKLAKITIRETSTEEALLDERLLRSSGIALAECRKQATKMAQIANASVLSAIALLDKFNPDSAHKTQELEKELDMLEDKVGKYLVRLSEKELTQHDNNELSMLLHTIGDFERIGDHAINLLESATEMDEKNIAFSENAIKELSVMSNAIKDILALTFKVFETKDNVLASKVEPLEQVIDKLKLDLKLRHIERLKKGACTIELGFVFSDIITDYERISDHCSNIAIRLIQMDNTEIDSHDYFREIKNVGNEEFISEFNNYQKQYMLPKNK